VTACNSARENEFVQLLEQHKKLFFKIARLYCRNQADFADIVQEIVLQAWRSFGRYDHSRPFSTWLYRIGLNVAISAYRAETRRSRTIVPADESIFEIAATSSEAAELESQLELLHNLIAQFNDLDKALVLLYLDGNSNGDIAEILGISVTNVGTRISRIKQKLQRNWADLSKREYSHGLR
jgi:RNA polymerase sigma-70 factor (ECF subfamily)